MITVEVLVFPNGQRGRGRIDPSLPLDDIKADIVEAYGLGDPTSFDIAITPRGAGVRCRVINLRMATHYC